MAERVDDLKRLDQVRDIGVPDAIEVIRRESLAVCGQ